MRIIIPSFNTTGIVFAAVKTPKVKQKHQLHSDCKLDVLSREM